VYIVAVVSGKGGVGKTTTAIALAAVAAAQGRSTLLVDLDPSASASRAAGIDPTALRVSATVLGLLADEPLTPARVPEGYVVLSGSPLAEPHSAEIRGAIRRLRELAVDLAIVDTPPGFGALAQAAVLVADAILTPIELEPMAVETIEQVRGLLQALGAADRWLGVVPTKVSPRLALTQLEMREVEGAGATVFSAIPRAIAVAEARLAARSIVGYSPNSAAARAYVELAGKVLQANNTITQLHTSAQR
jgi:chromosome partitioning protein